MNSHMIIAAVAFYVAATMVIAANVPNAPPVLLTAVAPPNPGDLNPDQQQGPGQPGAVAVPSKGDSDDQDTASTFGLLWGGYPWYGGYYGRGYYGGYYGGWGRPYYGGWYGGGWGRPYYGW